MVYYYILKARPCLNQTILTIKFISQIYRYLLFMARKNSTTRKVLMKSSAMKSKGCLVEEQLHKNTSQYSKFELFLPKTESYVVGMS